MKHIILGTAGHVDHGKTTLVHKITGHNTDRLKEEVTRGITIELGFAPFVLPNGQRIGIVDVPGHEKFVKNMLAGATGIDIFLLVIAADEGIMPQTKEHIDILRLLGVKFGIVVLTKIDMVDAEWLELISEDVREYLSTGPFKDSPIVEISSLTGKGLPELLKQIEAICQKVTERPSAGLLRLAIDRVFTMAGFGTIVTGTLWGGSIKSGDSVEILPSRKQARVRSLQVHGEKRDEAYAGERVAVNLTGIEKEFMQRGSWLTEPSALKEHMRVDIRLELLDDAPEISHRMRVHVHHGTTEVLARIKLLDTSVLAPGKSCFAQLELEEPLTAMPGDRVILRFYSPMFTIGGGTILDPAAVRHKKRQLEDNLSRLEALHSGDPKQVLLASITKEGIPWQIQDIASGLQISLENAQATTGRLTESSKLLSLSDGYYYPTASMDSLVEKAELWLSEYVKKWPMRFGAPKKEAAQFLLPKMDQKQQRAIFHYFDGTGKFLQDDKSIWLSGYTPILDNKQLETIDHIQALYDKLPLTPPTWTEVVNELNLPAKTQGEYLQWLHRSNRLVRVADDIHYTPSALGEAEKILRSAAPDGYTLGESRDILGISRKYAQKICEYFDLTKLTYWDGEKHYWRTEKTDKE